MGGHQNILSRVPRPGLSIFVIMRQGLQLGTLYLSYTNCEKERFVCRPSRVQGIHDGYDKKKQAVKMADVSGIEKVRFMKAADSTVTLPQKEVMISAQNDLF